MNIIAFDTASDIFAAGLSVATEKVGEKRYFLTIDGGQKHSELIMEAAETLLKLAGIGKTDLHMAACMEGPGSFTGLRIGFAAVKGLSFALGIPFISVPTLDCMTSLYFKWPGIVIPLLDAKKNAFFAAIYKNGKRMSDYLDIKIEELIEKIMGIYSLESPPPLLILSGPASPLAFNDILKAFPSAVLDSSHKRGYAAELLNIAAEKGILDHNRSLVSSGPEYVRKSDAELGGIMD